MRFSVFVGVLIVASIALAVPSIAAADECKRLCQASGVREEAIRLCRASNTRLPSLVDCVTTADETRSACLDDAKAGFLACRDEGCQSTAQNIPGRCTLTIECVDHCVESRDTRRARCKQEFSLERVCTPRCVRLGDRKLRNCAGNCRHGRPPSSTPSAAAVPTPAGVTQATTTTVAGEVTTTSTSTNTTTAASEGGDCGCQADCVRGFVGDCYGECDDRCKGEKDALRLCKTACRNAQCGRLQNRCVAGNAAYDLCCKRCGDVNCLDSFECEVTTTSTSRTTTSTTPASTSTTSTTVTSGGVTTTSLL